ncbi:hypothetical protein [Candidatus Allofournierella excrementavium]|uniref:hypothetical protein n=1 Tax=Candidatus Allofournierella excrementavium TaxID=2838591 RepID=UPI003AB5ECCF
MTKKTVSPDTFCPLLVIAHAMAGGAKSVLCGSNCGWFDSTRNACALAALADNSEQIADTLGQIADRMSQKEAQ